MQNDKSKLKPIVRLKGFTLLELLIVMSIIVLLMSILLPCLRLINEHPSALPFQSKRKCIRISCYANRS
ncbi:MAG: type II secretion system protein [Planctomycetota bacterium]